MALYSGVTNVAMNKIVGINLQGHYSIGAESVPTRFGVYQFFWRRIRLAGGTLDLLGRTPHLGVIPNWLGGIPSWLGACEVDWGVCAKLVGGESSKLIGGIST